MLTKKDLLDGFSKTNVKKGGTIVVHTSYKSLGGVEGGADTVIDALRELVGTSGTVLFPAFNFQSWTETHYFDVMETPSKMGMITERRASDLTQSGRRIRSIVSLFRVRSPRSFQKRRMSRRTDQTLRLRCSTN